MFVGFLVDAATQVIGIKRHNDLDQEIFYRSCPETFKNVEIQFMLMKNQIESHANWERYRYDEKQHFHFPIRFILVIFAKFKYLSLSNPLQREVLKY